MLQELNQQLKSMYLEPRSKLRVDVDYVIGRLQEIVCVGETMYSADANKHILSIPTWELEEFIDELKENNDNHNKKLNLNKMNKKIITSIAPILIIGFSLIFTSCKKQINKKQLIKLSIKYVEKSSCFIF